MAITACACAETDLRLRTHANGTKHVYRQCLACGRAVGSAVPHAQAEKEKPDGLLLFDEELRRQQQETRQLTMHLMHAAEHDQEQRQFEARYEEHIASEKWASLRQAVVLREHGQCQGCGRQYAHEVHHLTYKHLGDEFLFELVLLCSSCHRRAHGA